MLLYKKYIWLKVILSTCILVLFSELAVECKQSIFSSELSITIMYIEILLLLLLFLLFLRQNRNFDKIEKFATCYYLIIKCNIT